MQTSALSELQNVNEIKALESKLPDESPLTIRVNGEELATLMCSRTKLTYLVVGFLYLQGVVKGISEIACIKVCDQDLVAEVTITVPYDFNSFHKQKAITSGCTGGLMCFNDKLKPIDEEIETSLTVTQVFKLIKQLYSQAQGYRETGGTHSSALSADGENLLVHAEDVGRHNTIDKLAGFCEISSNTSRGGVIVSTGRISSEMVAKAARMEVPILISRTSPTSLAVQLAEQLGITLVGYVRGGNYSVYTYPWRIKN